MMRLHALLLLAACNPTSSPATVSIAPVDASAPPPVDATLARASTTGLAIADDPRRSVDERCADAFAAFRTRIHPGDSAAAVRAVLGSPTWLGSDLPIDILAGEVPVEWTAKDQVVVFMCLSKPDPRTGIPWSRYIVYARLEGRDRKTFGSFLASGSTKKLVEYALCQTDEHGPMKIERFR